MKYVCKTCGFIHLGEMPDGYVCPYCASGLFDFELIQSEEKVYNRIAITDKLGINRIEEKCINCGACARTCENVMQISAEQKEICLSCGACILTCPVAALTPKYDYLKLYDLLKDKSKKVIGIVSPAVRVGLGDAFNQEAGEFLEKKIVGVLKALGFSYVFDVSFGADLTSMEEAKELLDRIENKKGTLYSSCCPSWVMYAKKYLPKLKTSISTCKSPIEMMSSMLKNYYLKDEDISLDDVFVVAITPCTSKKVEIIGGDTDMVITTSELANMIREFGIVFDDVKEENFDNFAGTKAGTRFGKSGGVTLSVLKCLYYFKTGKDLDNNEVYIKDNKFYKEYKLKMGKTNVRCASVSTMKNLLALLMQEEDFDFVEVMNCDGGCISGGGQVIMPVNQKQEIMEARRNSLELNTRRRESYPYKNEIIKDLYDDFFDDAENAEVLLHKKTRLN